MPPYHQMGSFPRKRHIAHHHEPGYHGEGIYYEEVVTTAGFGRAYSILYHLRPPTRVRKIEAAGSVKVVTVDEPTLRHHHLTSGHMARSGDPVTGRVVLLTNDDVSLARCRPERPQAELYRTATGRFLVQCGPFAPAAGADSSYYPDGSGTGPARPVSRASMGGNTCGLV